MVDYKIQLKSNENIKLEGYMDINEIDDEEPLHWFDSQGFAYNSNFPKNPCIEDDPAWEDYEVLINSFFDDDLFLQFLADFSDENKTVDRGDYLLIINDGSW